MYAHPSFRRERPDLLMQLQKCKNAADRKRNTKVSPTQMTNSPSRSAQSKALSFETTTLVQEQEVHNGLTRTVTPCSSQGELLTPSDLREFDSRHMSNEEPAFEPQLYPQQTYLGMSSPSIKLTPKITPPNFHIPESYNEVRVGGSIGKIGLLALAMRCLVEEDMP